MQSHAKRTSPWVLLPLILALLCAGARSLVSEAPRRAETPQEQTLPLEYLPSAESALALSLGHRQALADLFWIRAVLYLYNSLTTHQQYQWLDQYIQIIETLDPRFEDIYHWGGMVMIFTRPKATYEDVERANTILERGIKLFPHSYRLPSSAAANCSYYVKDPSPEEKKKLHACRKKFMEIAANSPDAPYHAILLAAQFNREGEAVDTEKMCDLLATMYTSRNDPELRTQIEHRMKGGICGQISVERLRAMNDRFERARQNAIPYIHPDLVPHIIDLEPFAPSNSTLPQENLP